MNLSPLYALLFRTGVLPFVARLVDRGERLISDVRYDMYRAKYDIHDSFLKRRNEGIEIYGDGAVQTGPGSYIGRHSRVKAGRGTTISIGSGCALSHDVAIYSVSWVADQDFGDRRPTDFDSLAEQSGDVRIGDDVWVGYNAFVTPGTTIGSNAVVGANSVVTHDVPPNSIAVGSPATVVAFKSTVSESRKRELAREHTDAVSEELKSALSVTTEP